ncbi:MAG TPA: TetR/AcrR family transcriptional regulator [Sporichthyaceae bacterium]|jgi:AcrR family transcriptional regulator|nr:TetR/AcrR family transcriptional regulator [Sporichthyaceae bacterium]
MRTNTQSGKQRLEPAAFFNAAMKILAERGAEELTVDSVCAHLGVTKGSFYHHFENTAEFTAGLLACWEGIVDQYVEMTRALADPARIAEASWPAHVNRPHEAEAALRAWANSNPMVATTVRRADQKLEGLTVEWLESFIEDPQRARMLAHMWVSLVAGLQQRERPLDRAMILAVTLEFLRTNLGIEADVDGDCLQVHRMPGPARERPRSTRVRETVRRKST